MRPLTSAKAAASPAHFMSSQRKSMAMGQLDSKVVRVDGSRKELKLSFILLPDC
jgi:hypothetical protein